MPAKKSVANQTLGEAIRSARRQCGYTQEGFARRASMDRSYYGAIERGEFNLSIDTVLKITAALEMTACELFRRAKL
jgi:transcriptional regulator with XRE-family HTH domain